MFNKKKCPNCNEKINENYNFCPYCRTPLSEKDWGMLGKNDIEDEMDELTGFLGNIGGGVFGKIISSTMKMIEREMQKEMTSQKKIKPQTSTNIRLMINGKEIDIGNSKFKRESSQAKITKKLPNNKLKNFSTLPRKEPSSNVRRIGNKVVYEINVPGVNSIENLSINQLENSIEIKATSKSRSYSKIIPINLPIKDYLLEKGKLILELDAKD